jgi:hypothetical protein
MPTSPTPPSALFQTLSGLLDGVQTALVQQDAEQAENACKALMQGLSAELSQQSSTTIIHAMTAVEAESLASRFALLRQSLAQLSAANGRQLSVLLPEQLPSAYGGKSAFGSPSRFTHLKSYQA